MSKIRALAKTTATLSVGKIALQGATFLVLPLYTLYLATEQYGIIDLVLSYVALLLPVATLRLEAAVFRRVTAARSNNSKKSNGQYVRYALRKTTLVLLAFFLLTIIAVMVVQRYYPLYLWMIIVIQAYYAIISEYLRGMGGSQSYAISALLQGVLLLMSSVLFVAVLGGGVYGALLAIILSSFGALLYVAITAKKYSDQEDEKVSEEDKRDALSFSLPLIPSALSWWAINTADRTIIALTLGLSATGIFAVASKFAAILMVLFPIFGMALTEAAILHINAKDSAQFFSKAFDVALRASVSIGILIIAGVGVLLPMIIGPEFIDARSYIPILIVATLFNNVVGLYSAIYIAKKMTKQIMIMSLVAAGVSVVLTLIGIGVIGLYAAALSTVIAYGIMMIWRHFEIKRLISISYDKKLLIGLVAILLLVSVLYYFNTTTTNIMALCIAAGAALWLNRRIVTTARQFIKSRK